MARYDDHEDDEALSTRRFRLLPVTMAAMALFLVIKVNEVYVGSAKLQELYGTRDAVAEEKKAEEKKADAKKEDAKDASKPAEGEKKDDASVKTGEIKAEDKPAEGEKKEGDKKEGDKKDGKDKKPEEEKTFGTGKSTVKEIEAIKARDAQPLYTQNDLDLLQDLSKRREALDQRERDLAVKEKVLDAAAKRVDDKINEMKTLETELASVVTQYNEKQDERLKSLVKIYENMKPEEAAAIFNEMDMPILLDVIGKMSERKVALVLAGMSPKKAKDVTQELAERRKKTSSPVANAAGVKPAQ